MALQQFLTVFVFIFIIGMIPFIIWYIYTLFGNRKYKYEAELIDVRLERKSYGLFGDCLVPVYRYRYNCSEYETESKYVKISLIDWGYYKIDEKVKIRLKVNPDDPYDVKENTRFFIKPYIEIHKYDIVIGILCIITAIVTFLVVLKIA